MFVREMAVQPRRFDRFVDWVRTRRHLQLGVRMIDLIGADVGAPVRHPLLDPRFLSAYAAEGGRRGFGERTDAMCAVFGDVLPRELLERSTKASFDGVFMGDYSKAFAERWDGGGLDPELVDVEALRANWSGAMSFRSMTLMQWLWLRERGERA
jgi:asparagine synthase (glutamine-hydrolysing)